MLFLYGFGNAASYVLARTVADSTFLSQFGTGRLPDLYLLSAGVVALASIVYSRAQFRLGLRRTVVATLLAFAVASLLLPTLMLQYPTSLPIFTGCYLLAQIRGSLGSIQFATVLNERFGNDRPERIVGIVGAGATIAGFSMGLMISVLADYVAVRQLLYIAALIDLGTILPFLLLRNRKTSPPPLRGAERREASHSTPTPHDRAVPFRVIWQSRYLTSLTVVVALCILATTLVEYQWKVAATGILGGDAEALAKFFGYFYGAVYLATGVLQIFVTSRLLKSKRIFWGLVVLPFSLVIGASFAWLAATQLLLFVALTFCKSTDVLRRSFQDPAIQVIYGPLDRRIRRQAITFVAGMAKPFSEAVAGGLIVLLAVRVGVQHLSIVVVLMALGMLLASRFLWQGFRAMRGGLD